MSQRFTVEDAVRVQRDLKLGHVHVVYFDPDEGYFVLAHTNVERGNQLAFSLEQCVVHLWLLDGGGTCCFGGRERDCFGCFDGGAGWYTIPAHHYADGLPL